MEKNSKDDIIELLPKNILFIIFGFAFDVGLFKNENKKNTFQIKNEKDDEIEYLRNIAREEKNFCNRMVVLNNLNFVNKKWNKFFCNEKLWEQIILNLPTNFEFVYLPKLPETFCYKTFNKFMLKRSQSIRLRIDEALFEEESAQCSISIDSREYDDDI